MNTTLARGLLARALLTAGCLCLLAWMHPIRQAQAEESECANGRCAGATACTYRAGESCAFLDPHTCVTYRCKPGVT